MQYLALIRYHTTGPMGQCKPYQVEVRGRIDRMEES
jgi:hypothetical protein